MKLNFGPHFVYPPNKEMQPVSDLCSVPPRPKDVLDTVLSTSNASKKVDERVVTAFKDLVKKESAIRRDAYLRHVAMQKKEILKLRTDRGLSTHDLQDTVKAPIEQSVDECYASMHF